MAETSVQEQPIEIEVAPPDVDVVVDGALKDDVVEGHGLSVAASSHVSGHAFELSTSTDSFVERNQVSIADRCTNIFLASFCCCACVGGLVVLLMMQNDYFCGGHDDREPPHPAKCRSARC